MMISITTCRLLQFALVAWCFGCTCGKSLDYDPPLVRRKPKPLPLFSSLFRGGSTDNGGAIPPGNQQSRHIMPHPLLRSIAQEAPLTRNRIGRATKQIATHIAGGNHGFPTSSRMIFLSGAVCYVAARHFISRSEAAQRACLFWKRAGPIVVHYKFTQWWLTTTKAPIEHRHAVYKSLHDRYCSPSLDIILSLKGLYVKMGQVMSSRSDFMPLQYVELFSTVQDSIPQWPIELAISIVRDSLRTELDLEYEDVFETIDPIAIGCASIGQVHKGVLRDPWAGVVGKEVAVKIMHPDAKKRFACDFQVMKWLFRLAMPGWSPLLEELERRLMTEFDYHNEANNLSLLRNNMLQSPYAQRVKIPQPYIGFCCRHMLVMEMLDGKKFKDAIEDKLSQVLGGDKEKAHEFLEQRHKEVLFGEVAAVTPSKTSIYELLNIHGIGGLFRAMKGLALYRKLNADIDLLVDVHGHQIFLDGAFNADPHPGNILELTDGRLGLIDYGQTRKLNDEERLSIARVVVDLGRKADSKTIAESMRLAGFRTKFDGTEELAQYAALFFDSDHKCREKGYATPQHYFQALMALDPLINVPDATIMVARVSLLFRGAGSALGRQVQTSDNWLKHAEKALKISS